MIDHASRARSFDAWAGDYDRYRPGYPLALFQTIQVRLGLPKRPLVVDVGAGTGRATLAMAGLGWRVTAVEPGKPMLEVLRAQAANEGLLLATVQATAEATGLDPASVDLATAAQSFHWFDRHAALTEMARIIRPGGGVAVFWNTRDADASPLLADYATLLDQYANAVDTDRDRAQAIAETRRAFGDHPAFADPELIELRHEESMTADGFMGLAFTASYIRLLPPETQDRFRIELAAILGRYGHNDETPFSVPYRIDLWIARRQGG